MLKILYRQSKNPAMLPRIRLCLMQMTSSKRRRARNIQLEFHRLHWQMENGDKQEKPEMWTQGNLSYFIFNTFPVKFALFCKNTVQSFFDFGSNISWRISGTSYANKRAKVNGEQFQSTNRT